MFTNNISDSHLNKVNVNKTSFISFETSYLPSTSILAPGSLATGIIVFLVLLVIVFDVSAANLECEPVLKVTNFKHKSIKVLKMKYRGDSDMEYKVEGLANKVLAPNETETWASLVLEHVASGNPIKDILIKYKDDTSGENKPSSPWGPAKWTTPIPQTGDCTNNRIYSLKITTGSDGRAVQN